METLMTGEARSRAVRGHCNQKFVMDRFHLTLWTPARQASMASKYLPVRKTGSRLRTEEIANHGDGGPIFCLSGGCFIPAAI
jgi:hypothetical protein